MIAIVIGDSSGRKHNGARSQSMVSLDLGDEQCRAVGEALSTVTRGDPSLEFAHFA